MCILNWYDIIILHQASENETFAPPQATQLESAFANFGEEPWTDHFAQVIDHEFSSALDKTADSKQQTLTQQHTKTHNTQR